jgi:hypothetical protein
VGGGARGWSQVLLELSMNSRVMFFTLIAGWLLLATSVPGANFTRAEPALSIETRETLAVLHEKMAACLRSGKPVFE